MEGALLRLRNVSLQARHLFLPLSNTKRNPNSSLVLLALSNCSRPRLYSSESESDSFGDTKLVQTQKQNGSLDVEDVSYKELKTRIEKYFAGDEEAIPSIFEAILKRKLSGKHDESDDELIGELRQKTNTDDVKDQEYDSFSEDMETDEEDDDS